ncbi:hypothetical protein VNO78_15928 [Psophocarpus tetragonolobus]|uniref:Uncharacterized protein n=1 Tax=Psophocarpus tetragonolobus TaxID=3891 RepID=A0AAN9SG96_PSOTE
MGSIKKERRVLKLVHPGRHIEVLKEPIRAAEVMRKNPRHCITRPDVFEFPWIVVKPESVLLPGSVFLIVPNHTIYDLLKARTTQSTQSQSQSHSPFSLDNQPHTNHVHQQFSQDSHGSSYDGMSFTPQRHNQNFKLFHPLLSPISERSSNCASETMSKDMENVCSYYRDKRSQNQSYYEIGSKVASYEEESHEKMELLDSSTFEFRPYCKALKYYEKYSSRDIGTDEMLEHKKDVHLKLVSSEHVTVLKSSLRRPNSMRKKLNLKVSFNLPMEKEG